MEVIGEKLKASREEKGLSLEEVSEDLKIDIKDLENIEIGNRKYFDDVYSLKNYIYEYAKYLGLAVSVMFSEKKTLVFSFRKYSLSRTALRTCSAPNVLIRKARAVMVSRL